MEIKEVAEGLRDFLRESYSPPEEMDYYGPVKEAIKILTPRVLTLEEADEADVCWIEARGARRVPPCRISVRREHVILKRFGTIEEIGHTADYNVDFRCWSLRPDEDLMRKTPWAGVSEHGQLSRAAEAAGE